MSNLSQDILDFWMKDVGPVSWQSPDTEMAKQMRSKFGLVWQEAVDGRLGCWVCEAHSCLSLVLLLDQFSRVMFKGNSKALEADHSALAIAKRAIVMGHDLKVEESLRQFFYLPLMHSESLMDQERCVRLMTLRLPKCPARQIGHAKAHRDIIRQFGRFPCRNEILGRVSTESEKQYIQSGGYERIAVEFAA